MSTLMDIGTLIVCSDDIRGGRPRIAGTGVTRRIAEWYRLGLTPSEIADRLEHLTLAQVYAALTYYHANQSEIEADITREEEESLQFEQSLKEEYCIVPISAIFAVFIRLGVLKVGPMQEWCFLYNSATQ